MSGIDRRVKRRRWSDTETLLLISIVRSFGRDKLDWETVSETFGGPRSAGSCWEHWSRVCNPDIRKGEFSESELRLLAWNVKLYGGSRWSKVSMSMNNRTDLQCRREWRSIMAHRRLISEYLLRCVDDRVPFGAAKKELIGDERLTEEEISMISMRPMQVMKQ